MWKYRCKSQLFTLLIAFGIGALLTALNINGSSLQSILSGYVPDEMISVLENHQYILWICGGLCGAGLCNIFLVTNTLAVQFSTSPILFLIPVMFFPTVAMTIGIYGLPVTIAVFLYGWISLVLDKKRQLKAKNLSSADEIVRIYKIHHPLEEQYKPLGEQVRHTTQKITWIYALGIVAVLCVIFFIDNLIVSIIAIFLYVFAFQILQKSRAQAFKPISDLLYEQCNPQGCMSALIYFCQRGKNHYKLTSQGLMASCLIYLNDPNLAQDVLVTFPKSNNNAILTYYSLLASTYYMLKDQNGLERCKEEISKIKPGMGAVGLMIKSEEQQAINNKINLMNRNFTECKKFYLERFKKSPIRLQKAECAYYLALISFVEEDYQVAEVYFEKAIQLGGSIYFVKNAQNYLAKIQAMNDPQTETVQIEIREA
ncbi:MAG: hypothetical protein HUJ54_07365 [Erysipelotrichaceae bacterium]|nr:hypothetical protein [Erysipelotrichaceae bacterium]